MLWPMDRMCNSLDSANQRCHRCVQAVAHPIIQCLGSRGSSMQMQGTVCPLYVLSEGTICHQRATKKRLHMYHFSSHTECICLHSPVTLEISSCMSALCPPWPSVGTESCWCVRSLAGGWVGGHTACKSCRQRSELGHWIVATALCVQPPSVCVCVWMCVCV